MNPESSRILTSLPMEGYLIQICWRGKRRKVLVHSPRSAFAFLDQELGARKDQLIMDAQHIINDASMAEDIVQSSYTNAYCHLNNGKLYVLKFEHSYLFVRGGKNVDLLRVYSVYERTIQRWLNGLSSPNIEVIEKPFAWLKTIVQNNAYKYYKKQKKYRAFCTTPKNWSVVEEASYPSPEKIYLKAERGSEIRELVAALPPHYREIVRLRFFGDRDYSFQEIAAQLGRPVHTVTSQSSRALKMIEEGIKGERVIKEKSLVRQKKSAS